MSAVEIERPQSKFGRMVNAIIYVLKQRAAPIVVLMILFNIGILTTVVITNFGQINAERAERVAIESAPASKYLDYKVFKVADVEQGADTLYYRMCREHNEDYIITDGDMIVWRLLKMDDDTAKMQVHTEPYIRKIENECVSYAMDAAQFSNMVGTYQLQACFVFRVQDAVDKSECVTSDEFKIISKGGQQ